MPALSETQDEPLAGGVQSENAAHNRAHPHARREFVALGVALAAFAGVLAAPLYPVSPTMGSSLLIVVFAVVVIGGMGSILGAILTGLAMGLIEGLTKVFYPEAANTVIFVVMVMVLMLRPAGLFGKEA